MGRKISDGKSVKVNVGASTTIVQGNFYALDGFLGMAIQSMKTDSDGKVIEYNGLAVATGLVPAKVVLNLEEMEVETSQLLTSDTYNVGTKIYYDEVNKRFTTTAGSNIFAGVVTQAKDINNVIWFNFMPNSALVAAARGSAKGFVTFTLNGSLTTNYKVANFVFNKAVTVTKVKARVGTLPGATAAFAFNVKNGANSIFAADKQIASTDTAHTFKEFTPDADPARNVFAADGVLSVNITNAGDTAAADLEVVIEYDQSV